GHVWPGGRVVVVLSLHQSRDEGLARRLARARRREEDFLEHGIAGVPRILEVFGEARFFEVHDVLAAARSRADEDHPTNDRRTVLRHVLGDHAAERETEDVAPVEVEAVEKGHDVRRHSGHRLRHLSARTPDARVVEENDLPSRGERITHRRIPVVERSGEVLQAEQRQSRAVAEATVGVGMAAPPGGSAWERSYCWRSRSMTSASPTAAIL